MKLQLIAFALLMLITVSCRRNYQVKVIAKNKNTGAPLVSRSCNVYNEEHRDGVFVTSATTNNNGEAILSFDMKPSHFISVMLDGNCVDERWRGEARDLPSEVEFKCE